VIVAILVPAVTLGQATTDAPPPTTGGVRDRDRALAGAKEINNDIGRANFHFGNWYLLTRVSLSDIGFTEEFFVPTGDHGGGLAVSVAAPTRLYFIPTRKVVLTGEFVPGISYFNATEHGTGDKTQFNYSARGGVQFLFNHLFLDFYAAKADQLRPRIADINRLSTAKSDELGFSGELKYSSRTSTTFSTRFLDTKYPSSRHQPLNIPVDLLDHKERDSRAQLVHKTLPHTSLTLAGEQSKFEFDRATYKNGTRTYVAPGFLYDAGRFTLRGEAGPARITYDDPAQHEFSGILGLLNSGWRSGKYSIGAGVERDTDFTIYAGNNYYVLTRADVELERTMTRRLKLRAGVAAERDDYEVLVLGNKRRDEVAFPSVGFRYTFHRLQTGLDVGYYKRTSTFGGDEDHGIRYIVHLSFTP
jgi:hypothetical protein